MASEQARRLVARGHEVTVLTERVRDALPADSNENGVRIIRYGCEKQFARFGGASRTDMKEVAKVLCEIRDKKYESTSTRNLENSQSRKFDIAILHHPYSAYGFVKSGLKIPSLYLFHTSTSREAEVEGIKRILPAILEPFRPFLNYVFIARTGRVERKVLRAMNSIAVLSDFSRLILKSAFPFTEKKIVKLPIGIDLVTFSVSAQKEKIRARLGLPVDLPAQTGKKILLTVRRFTPRMGLLELVKAFELVLSEIPDAHLLIVGEGPQRAELEKTIAEKSLQSKITLVGAVAVDDLPLYYQAADLFVLPTAAFEGLGMATLEALACGLPVVGTPAGATLEVLGALDPTLVTKSTSAEDIARGILGFFVRSKDEQEALSKKAREVAEEQYSWDRGIDELEQVIKTLIHENIKTGNR